MGRAEPSSRRSGGRRAIAACCLPFSLAFTTSILSVCSVHTHARTHECLDRYSVVVAHPGRRSTRRAGHNAWLENFNSAAFFIISMSHVAVWKRCFVVFFLSEPVRWCLCFGHTEKPRRPRACVPMHATRHGNKVQRQKGRAGYVRTPRRDDGYVPAAAGATSPLGS